MSCIASVQSASAFMGLGPTGGGTFTIHPGPQSPPKAPGCWEPNWSAGVCSRANTPVKTKPRTKNRKVPH
jgi:hypothetical protein